MGCCTNKALSLITLRGDFIDNWLREDPILSDKEVALVTLNKENKVYDRYVVGDGIHKFSELKIQFGISIDSLKEDVTLEELQSLPDYVFYRTGNDVKIIITNESGEKELRVLATTKDLDDRIIDTDHIENGAVTTPKIADGAVTDVKLAPFSVGETRLKNWAVTTNKIYNGAVTGEKLSKWLQDNLAHKAVVYDFNVNIPEDIPQLVRAYKADANQSVFLVYRSGMYYPAALLTKKDNEAIIFYQPEGRNFRKVIVRASTGTEEVVIYGDTVRYGKQFLTDAQKQQAKQNIDAGTKAYIIELTQSSSEVEAIIEAFQNDENKSQLYVKTSTSIFPANYDRVRGVVTTIETTVPFIVGSEEPPRIDIIRYSYYINSHKWSTNNFPKIYRNAVSYESQVPSEAEQEQARKNIGALSSEDGAVQTANIKDYAVIGKKISSGAITNDKIRAGAVSVDKLNTDLQAKVNDNVKFVEQNLTKEQQLQARKNIELPDYETFDDLRKLSTLTAKRLLYVGIDNVYPGFPISVNSSIEEIDFQGKKIYFSALNAEQIAFKGHPNCKLKNLSCVLTTADYTKDANVCISKFGYVENVTVDCLVYSSKVGKEVSKTVGFLSCDHLYNCKVMGGGVMGERGFTKGYSYCNYLNLCRYKIGGELIGATGFEHCQFISQCYVNRQSEEVMGLGTNSNVESLIWILADGSFETFSDIDHITVGGYDTTNMFKTIGSVGGTGKTKLYAKPDDKPGIATVLLDITPVNWAVARRTPTGTLKAKDAVEDDDTVTKKQLDTLKTEVTKHLTEDEVANLWDTTN